MADPSVEQKAEELARAAADRAARLALIDAEEKTKLAVDRAVKDALIDRELHDHSEHLKQINHSQEKAAASLISLQTSFDELSISNQAVAKYVTEQSAAHFSRRTLWLMAIGGLGGYAGLIALLISNHP
jgi:hypothetical protein